MLAGLKKDAGHHLRSIWRLLLYVCVCAFSHWLWDSWSDLKLWESSGSGHDNLMPHVFQRLFIKMSCSLLKRLGVYILPAVAVFIFTVCTHVSKTQREKCVYSWVKARRIIAEAHTAKLAISRLSLSLYVCVYCWTTALNKITLPGWCLPTSTNTSPKKPNHKDFNIDIFFVWKKSNAPC